MPLPVDAEPRKQPSAAGEPTLASFVRCHRVELIERCRDKVAQRAAPALPLPPDSSGVPHFLQQLLEVLDCEDEISADEAVMTQGATSAAAIGPAAAAHGSVLMRHGYSLDQVVHEYGDVCQAVTELALAQQIPFSTNDFRILNRCLDDAIADAVTAYQNAAQQTLVDAQTGLHRRLQMLIHDQQRLVGIARHSFMAIKSGHVGITGATGTLLAHALDELIQLAEERLPRVVGALRQQDQ